MPSFTSYLLSAVAGASVVAGHGMIVTPKPRLPGNAMKAACGQTVEMVQSSDNFGNIQDELQKTAGQSDYNAKACHIWLCKGYQYEDNVANVQHYTAGQTIPMHVDIRAPHTGSANVSVVDTQSNSVIGAPMIDWGVYASTSVPAQADQSSFSIKLPQSGLDVCTTPGRCVIQWYWNSPGADQTYER
jgi:Lytic polysaccharide mono-oxygenase, cellulose-degrading